MGFIGVDATLNDQDWRGGVSYTITGPRTISGTSVPQPFHNIPIGTYEFGYGGGGPPGALLFRIAPSATQTLAAGDKIVFTLRFVTPGTINVNATLNGSPWTPRQGETISYTITGPSVIFGSETIYCSSVPYSIGGRVPGAWALSYRSGGPSLAFLASITPSVTQNLTTGGTITFTLNFVRIIMPPWH